MSICLILNPHAGRRRARRRLTRFLEVWRGQVELWPTEHSGHGVALGKRAAESGFDVVAAADDELPLARVCASVD